MRAKKSLGQHFLTNKGILDKIADVAEIHNGDFVLEIGPGKGVLTRALLSRGAKVIAIEKDETLAEHLRLLFHSEVKSGTLKIKTGDILDFSIDKEVLNLPYKVVANIPYYITGAILRMFLETHTPPEMMTLLVQKEVAERILARDKKESLLSISVKVFGTPEIAGIVKAGSFTPAPKVDSAILKIKDISKDNFQNVKEKEFFKILKAGFAHKRKILSRNLEKVLEKSEIETRFKKCNLSQKSRAEDLRVEDWICIA